MYTDIFNPFMIMHASSNFSHIPIFLKMIQKITYFNMEIVLYKILSLEFLPLMSISGLGALQLLCCWYHAGYLMLTHDNNSNNNNNTNNKVEKDKKV